MVIMDRIRRGFSADFVKVAVVLKEIILIRQDILGIVLVHGEGGHVMITAASMMIIRMVRGCVANKMEGEKENKRYISVHIGKIKIFIFLSFISLLFGGFYVYAQTVSHEATEIEVFDYNGEFKTLQEAIDSRSLGKLGDDGKKITEACRFCVGNPSQNQDVGACDSQSYGDYALWKNYAGWTAGFAIEPYSGQGSHYYRTGSSWFFATGVSCDTGCSDEQCANCVANCCEDIPSDGSWNSPGQNCFGPYDWLPEENHLYWHQYFPGKEPYLNWWTPFAVNLCCKE